MGNARIYGFRAILCLPLFECPMVAALGFNHFASVRVLVLLHRARLGVRLVQVWRHLAVFKARLRIENRDDVLQALAILTLPQFCVQTDFFSRSLSLFMASRAASCSARWRRSWRNSASWTLSFSGVVVHRYRLRDYTVNTQILMNADIDWRD